MYNFNQDVQELQVDTQGQTESNKDSEMQICVLRGQEVIGLLLQKDYTKGFCPHTSHHCLALAGTHTLIPCIYCKPLSGHD